MSTNRGSERVSKGSSFEAFYKKTPEDSESLILSPDSGGGSHYMHLVDSQRKLFLVANLQKVAKQSTPRTRAELRGLTEFRK